MQKIMRLSAAVAASALALGAAAFQPATAADISGPRGQVEGPPPEYGPPMQQGYAYPPPVTYRYPPPAYNPYPPPYAGAPRPYVGRPYRDDPYYANDDWRWRQGYYGR